MLEKTSFNQLSKRKRRYVLFGSGNIAKKTIDKIGVNNIDFIVDNSINLQGMSFEGFNVLHPDQIKKDHFVLICSTALREISIQLKSLMLVPNQNYAASPILNDLLAIQELEELDEEFYFTSGSVPKDETLEGGGLYKCKVKGLTVNLEKIYQGPCYGAIQKGNNIYFVDTDKGIHAYNNVDGVVHKCELPKGSRAHGISYNKSNANFYVTCSYLDGVLEVNSNTFEINKEFKLSNKIDVSGSPMHHCNDNYAQGNSLFVSMFSSTGQWKLDRFDGCIAEFDIETGERLPDVFSGLYMPHNITIIDNSLHILDSLPGHLRFNNLSVQGTFPAFTRGLTRNKGLYYIGQSKNRNYSRVIGVSNNISIDCGVIVFNPELKASRFLQFPNTIGEIHAVCFLT